MYMCLYITLSPPVRPTGTCSECFLTEGRRGSWAKGGGPEIHFLFLRGYINQTIEVLKEPKISKMDVSKLFWEMFGLDSNRFAFCKKSRFLVITPKNFQRQPLCNTCNTCNTCRTRFTFITVITCITRSFKNFLYTIYSILHDLHLLLHSLHILHVLHVLQRGCL